MTHALPELKWHSGSDPVAPSFVTVHLNCANYNVEQCAEYVLTYLSQGWTMSMKTQIAIVDQIRRQNSERLEAASEEMERQRRWRQEHRR